MEPELDPQAREQINAKLVKNVNRAKERFKHFFVKYLPESLYETGEIKSGDRIYQGELEELIANIYSSRSRFVYIAKDFFAVHRPNMDIVRGTKQLNPNFDPQLPERETNKKYTKIFSIPSVYKFAGAVSACLTEYLRRITLSLNFAGDYKVKFD